MSTETRTAAQEVRAEARDEIVSDLRAAAARLEVVAARAREVAESIRVAGLRGDEHFADRVVVHNVPETLRDLATPLAGTAAANLDYAIRMVAQVAAGDRGSLAPEQAVRLVPRVVRSESGLPIDEADDWVCDCGNATQLDGFFPSDADGTELEPLVDGPWDGYTYACARCTRVIDGRYGTEIRGPGPVRWLDEGVRDR